MQTPNFFQNPPKGRLRGMAHGSIRIQEGEPALDERRHDKAGRDYPRTSSPLPCPGKHVAAGSAPTQVLSIAQQMRRGCGVSFHQQRT
jgi:hypothetical protein